MIDNEEFDREMDGSDAEDVEETELEDEKEEGLDSDSPIIGDPGDPIPEESELSDGGTDGEPEDGDEDDSLPVEPELSEETARYKLLSATSRPDVTGTMQHYPAGAVIELPSGVGDAYVEEGLAERVVE